MINLKLLSEFNINLLFKNGKIEQQKVKGWNLLFKNNQIEQQKVKNLSPFQYNQVIGNIEYE